MRILNYQIIKNTKTDYLYIQNYPAMAENTRKAYLKGWQCFEDHCHFLKVRSLPATVATVQSFLVHKSETLSLGSLELYLSAINKVHVINGCASFNSYLEIRHTMQSLARSNGRPVRRVKALLDTDLRLILDRLPPTPIGIRDAAVLAVGFSAALRRSEICALRFDDAEFIESSDGLKMFLNIRRSKTDQAGKGYRIGIIDGKNIRPVSRLQKWLESSQIEGGFLFRALKRGGSTKDTPLHHSDIPRLIKYYAAGIGLDPKDYAGHSLRSGFITSAAIYRARLDKIMEVSRHKSTDMVMSYVRDSNVFDDHAGTDFL